MIIIFDFVLLWGLSLILFDKFFLEKGVAGMRRRLRNTPGA